MYYSKQDGIAYISNPGEKLFIEKGYVDHITKNGTIRYDFLEDEWVVFQQYIEIGESKSLLPIKLVNNENVFILDLTQTLVSNVHNNFKVIEPIKASESKYAVVNNKAHYLIRPNAFFFLLRVIQMWGDVDFMEIDNNFFLSSAAKIEDVKILHCKLIYHQSQRWTI